LAGKPNGWLDHDGMQLDLGILMQPRKHGMEVLVHGSIKINGTPVAVVLAQLFENGKAL